MSQFPAAELEAIAEFFDQRECPSNAQTIRLAIARHAQLQERCVMDATEASLHIANLRARLAQVDPEFTHG